VNAWSATRTLRYACLACGLCATLGCSTRTRYAQTALEPRVDAGLDAASPNAGDRDAGPRACPERLSERLLITSIELSSDVRYKQRGYDLIPRDARIALSPAPNAGARVAWLENGGSRVHVTPLDALLERSGQDVISDGYEVGGLVALQDGFALLTRRVDPGEPLTDPNPIDNNAIGKAAFLVRYRGETESFAVPLTGTASITRAADPKARDCAEPALHARLAWNGTKYGAYFAVHGCAGDSHVSYYGDKLVYADDRGRALAGGWSWNCSIDQGLRLIAEPDVFTSVCLSDSQPFRGLNLVIAGMPAKQLAPEFTAPGYVGAQFGSLVKLKDDSYVVVWVSRGARDSSAREASQAAPDIAFMHLAPDYSVLEPLRWLLTTPNSAETNLHLAMYGSDRLFISWDSIEQLSCDNDRTCFGTYTGTHARLLDNHGVFVTPDEILPAVPNSEDDIAVLNDGDLAWAFVQEDARSYADQLPVDAQAVPRVASKRQIKLARLTYCE
jgi:hypothetical protein